MAAVIDEVSHMAALGVDFGAPKVNVDTLCGHKQKVISKLTGGIIGLEMGTVYSTLGARLDVVEMLDGLMQGADRDLVNIWQKMNAPRCDNRG